MPTNENIGNADNVTEETEMNETPIVDGEQSDALVPEDNEAPEGPSLQDQLNQLSLRVDATEDTVAALEKKVDRSRGNKISARLDRIVAAISHSKPVKGL